MSLGFTQVTNDSLVGTWQTTFSTMQGMPPATGVFKVQTSGQYREELYVQGQLAGFWEGTYTLSPDGTFVQQITNKSPQVCVGGRCNPNPASGTISSRLTLQGTNSFSISSQDAQTGQTSTLTWQRQGTASMTTTAQNSIVGVWQYTEPTSLGDMITIQLTYTPDGKFLIQRVANGQFLVSSYGGTYTYTNGVLTETTTQKSPQYCYQYCQPNPVQLGVSGPLQVSFPSPSTLIYAGLTFQKMPDQMMQTVPGTN